MASAKLRESQRRIYGAIVTRASKVQSHAWDSNQRKVEKPNETKRSSSQKCFFTNYQLAVMWWWIDHKLLHTVSNQQQVKTVVVSYCQEIPKDILYFYSSKRKRKRRKYSKISKKGSKIMRGFKKRRNSNQTISKCSGEKKKNTEYFLCQKQVPVFG